MQTQQRQRPLRPMRNWMYAALAAVGLVCSSQGVYAQTATIFGSAGNFDVVNNTGEDACGFEMLLENVDPSGSIYAFSYERYGAPKFTGYTNGAVSGTRVTWSSSDCTKVKTIPHTPGAAFAGTCYMGGGSYDTAGCEHFGVSVATTKVTSRWLVKDPANPGAYIPRDPPMAVPVPYYYIAPAPANGGTAPDPVVVAEVEAPEPAEAPELYGRAQWMKIFVRQLPREVGLDELLTINPAVVPMDPGQVEVNWDVIQAEPASNSNGNRKRSRKQGMTSLDPTTRSVVRRYELYDYTGAYDPITNEALCADLTCTAPADGEIGDFISAQMAAVNVQADNVTVTKSGTGGGNVDSSDKVISCGSKCTSPYTGGTVVALTAKANSGSTFAGWTGACTGTGTCTVTVRGAQNVGARFDPVVATGGGGGGGGGTTTTQATLKVSIGATGTVTSDVAGINCGSVCQAKYNKGTVVTLTATPPAGKTFASWSGACSGTATTCTLTLNADASVKALFNK